MLSVSLNGRTTTGRTGRPSLAASTCWARATAFFRKRSLALTNYFVEQRGAQPHYYDQEYEKRGQTSHWHTYGPAWMVKDKAYSQAHLPIAQQQTAIGHAVRFVYLMTGVAHLARLSHDESKRQDCLRLWNNMAQRQLYITGGIGSQSSGEAFSSDYDLPNDTVIYKIGRAHV